MSCMERLFSSVFHVMAHRPLCIVILSILIATGFSRTSYVGKRIGRLSELEHLVRGEVFAVDSRTIHIKGFTYDGTAPDAYFYVGKTGQKPHGRGIIVPNENGSKEPLSAYNNKDVTLTLPDSLTLNDIVWISIWCQAFSIDFGHVMMPRNFDYPRPQKIDAFPSYDHGVTSDKLIVVDAQTFLIPTFSYDGTAPDAFFWVGKGSNVGPTGIIVPDENGSKLPLKKYDAKTFVITLPDKLTVFDIDYMSIWCREFFANFGHVTIPKNLNVPPSLKMLGVAPQTKLNCEVLDEGLSFEVRWAVAGDSIVTQFVGKVGSEEYMAFGLSGSPTKSVMVGGDVTVAWLDQASGKGAAVDYFLEFKSQCQGGRGSCPDSKIQGSRNNVRLLNAAYINDFTMLTFQRPLSGRDRSDKDIKTTGPQAVIWAVGPVNSQGDTSYHDLRLRGDLLLDFGRSPEWNCPLPNDRAGSRTRTSRPRSRNNLPAPTKPVKSAWYIPPIPCYEPEDGVFYAQIGPTGGDQGYNAITGQVGWGISWYINGLLIPEINVVRGKTYTFVVEGGDDPSTPSKHHPFYITNDPEGGYSFKTPAERNRVEVYAGVSSPRGSKPEPTAFGRLCEWKGDPAQAASSFQSFGGYQRSLTLDCKDGQPGILQWTPDRNTPDDVYYQCFTHRYLGWKIKVLDRCDQTSPNTSSTSRPRATSRADYDYYSVEDQSSLTPADSTVNTRKLFRNDGRTPVKIENNVNIPDEHSVDNLRDQESSSNVILSYVPVIPYVDFQNDLVDDRLAFIPAHDKGVTIGGSTRYESKTSQENNEYENSGINDNFKIKRTDKGKDENKFEWKNDSRNINNNKLNKNSKENNGRKVKNDKHSEFGHQKIIKTLNKLGEIVELVTKTGTKKIKAMINNKPANKGGTSKTTKLSHGTMKDDRRSVANPKKLRKVFRIRKKPNYKRRKSNDNSNTLKIHASNVLNKNKRQEQKSPTQNEIAKNSDTLKSSVDFESFPFDVKSEHKSSQIVGGMQTSDSNHLHQIKKIPVHFDQNTEFYFPKLPPLQVSFDTLTERNFNGDNSMKFLEDDLQFDSSKIYGGRHRLTNLKEVDSSFNEPSRVPEHEMRLPELNLFGNPSHKSFKKPDNIYFKHQPNSFSPPSYHSTAQNKKRLSQFKYYDIPDEKMVADSKNKLENKYIFAKASDTANTPLHKNKTSTDDTLPSESIIEKYFRRKHKLDETVHSGPMTQSLFPVLSDPKSAAELFRQNDFKASRKNKYTSVDPQTGLPFDYNRGFDSDTIVYESDFKPVNSVPIKYAPKSHKISSTRKHFSSLPRPPRSFKTRPQILPKSFNTRPRIRPKDFRTRLRISPKGFRTRPRKNINALANFDSKMKSTNSRPKFDVYFHEFPMEAARRNFEYKTIPFIPHSKLRPPPPPPIKTIRTKHFTKKMLEINNSTNDIVTNKKNGKNSSKVLPKVSFPVKYSIEFTDNDSDKIKKDNANIRNKSIPAFENLRFNNATKISANYSSSHKIANSSFQNDSLHSVAEGTNFQKSYKIMVKNLYEYFQKFPLKKYSKIIEKHLKANPNITVVDLIPILVRNQQREIEFQTT